MLPNDILLRVIRMKAAINHRPITIPQHADSVWMTQETLDDLKEGDVSPGMGRLLDGLQVGVSPMLRYGQFLFTNPSPALRRAIRQAKQDLAEHARHRTFLAELSRKWTLAPQGSPLPTASTSPMHHRVKSFL